jgi:ketosteroid isomerase-like protein
VIAAFILIQPFAVAAGIGTEEQEVRNFLAAYDDAVATRDIAFLERVLPNDYVFKGASGKLSDRRQVLDFFTHQRNQPTYRVNSLRHENVKVHVVGHMAVVTNDYTSRTTPIDSPDSEPETTKGRHTGVLEKRQGRWMVIAEQDTEQAHDDKPMEREVAKAGLEYNQLMQRLKSGHSRAESTESGDIATLSRLLADGYTYTSSNGKVSGKAEVLDGYKTNRARPISTEVLQQRVLAIDNNTVVETGTTRDVGTNAGKPFETTRRYTITWVSWGEGWQIIAEHASTIK